MIVEIAKRVFVLEGLDLLLLGQKVQLIRLQLLLLSNLLGVDSVLAVTEVLLLNRRFAVLVVVARQGLDRIVLGVKARLQTDVCGWRLDGLMLLLLLSSVEVINVLLVFVR